LLLVHGTPWSSFNWRHVVEALTPWFTVHFYDLPGYGQSEKAEGQDVSLGVQGQILDRLLRHWDLSDPFVVGHDFGGTIVLRAHLLHRCDFRKLALVDPVALGPWGSPFFEHVRRHAQVFAELPHDIHRAIVTTYVRGATYHPMDQQTLRGIVQPWLGPTGQPAFYRQIAQADQRFTDEIEPLYAAIARPTLILWGREDGWIPVQRARQLQRQIPEAELHVVPHAGHLVQEDAPAQLVSSILRFFVNA
jgi:pimeloyl-ACP methyl ester carboxylesterase